MTKCTQVLSAQYRPNYNTGKTEHAHLFNDYPIVTDLFYFSAQKFITNAEAEIKLIHKKMRFSFKKT